MINPDDLDLPPRRPLPRGVHDRMRATLLDEMRLPDRTTRVLRFRPPVAVAAGVAVLALGVAVLGQSLVGSNGHTPASGPTNRTEKPAPGTPPPLDWSAAQATMDRCWTAIQSAGKAADVPARSTWQPVFAVPTDGLTVTAIRAGGKPLICGTTRTTVTVSDPNARLTYAAGSKTAALLVSADGFVGGVMDPSWTAMQYAAISRFGSSVGGPGFFQDGMFIDVGGFTLGGRNMVRQIVPGLPTPPPIPDMPTSPGGVSSPAKPGAGQTHPELDLPAGPAALVAAVDRPDPPTDRTSAAGQFLGQCIATTDYAVVDPASWQPLAMVGTAPNRYVLARSGDQMGIAVSGTGYPNLKNLNETNVYYGFARAPRPLMPNKPIQYSYGHAYSTDSVGEHQTVVFLGLLRPDVTSIEIIAPDGTPRSVGIVHGTFSAEFHGATLQDMPRFTIVVRDKSGRELYHGPIATDY